MLPIEEIEVNGISNDSHFAFKVFYIMVGIYIHVCERIKYVIFILISSTTYRVCSYHVNHACYQVERREEIRISNIKKKKKKTLS